MGFRKNKSMKHKIMKGVAVLGAIGLLCFGLAILMMGMLTVPIGEVQTPVRITITKGESLRRVAEMLYENKLIRSAPIFTMYAFLRGDASRILPGSYEITGNNTFFEILSKITKGPEAFRVTLREGMTIREVDAYLGEQGIIVPGSLFSYKPDKHLEERLLEYGFSSDKRFKHLEGFLFPDTYEFVREEGAESVVLKMVDNFEDKVGLALKVFTREERYKKMIIASLIEKEVANDYERRVVSGIIERRLKVDMPLQVDASILYGTCVEYGDCDRILHKKDFVLSSPFNTYTNRGLPPRPIANFGMAALRAALSPEKTSYWYYLSTSDGKTFFSKTFKEHDDLRAKYLFFAD